MSECATTERVRADLMDGRIVEFTRNLPSPDAPSLLGKTIEIKGLFVDGKIMRAMVIWSSRTTNLLPPASHPPASDTGEAVATDSEVRGDE